ncbi:hypothetical protein B566_EDAN008241 [Ephemera danica]|nr:hypothetical protein B566_EDAN008241 [Ephemera danica]
MRAKQFLQPGNSPFQLLLNSVKISDSRVECSLLNAQSAAAQLTLQLTAVKDCTFRLQVDEVQAVKKRYQVEFALAGEPQLEKLTVVERTSELLKVQCGDNLAVLHSSPFQADFYSGTRLAVSLNAQGLMKFEHYRNKPEEKEAEEAPAEGGEEAAAPEEQHHDDEISNDIGAWQENFKSHHDSKPLGPSSVGLDFSFPGADYAYGIPEHSDSFALKATKDTDPYRLYNLDVFEYELDNGMALYGSIPFLFAHGEAGTSGVLWLNAAETWVDIGGGARQSSNVVSSIVNFVSGSGTPPQPLNARFFSESGVIDAFIFLGPSPQDVSAAYAHLTGSMPLPPYFSLGYHQCRWNYNDQEDVRGVDAGFDEHDIPYDVIWLDIEYTDGKKYFTWDHTKFPQPSDMVANLTSKGHRLVVIIDPHIKRETGYFLHDEATTNGYYVKNKDGNDYEGWCWPGAASYLDFFNPVVRDYYSSRYKLDKFEGTSCDVHIWNDMNEPSVFNGPEGKLRPFILTRSFFVGSQRYAAIWTGDNFAEWGHLKASIPMCLSVSIAGIPFCGADIGGFFRNPDSELFYRWYQAGAFQPFMRAHSHIDTKRREPWLFDSETTELVRAAIRRRYEIMPMWYTLFFEHERTGMPVMRPLWYHYPSDKSAFTIEDQYLLGDILLVHPVMESGATEVSVYFPGSQDLWYDADTLEMFSRHGTKKVATPKTKIPVYQRGGTVLAKKERIRRSTALTHDDPFTLVVALDINSYSYREKQYLYLGFNFNNKQLTCKFIDTKAHFTTKAWLERVIILGLNSSPSKVMLYNKGIGEKELQFAYNPNKHLVVLRKPGVSMAEEWSIALL